MLNNAAQPEGPYDKETLFVKDQWFDLIFAIVAGMLMGFLTLEFNFWVGKAFDITGTVLAYFFRLYGKRTAKVKLGNVMKGLIPAGNAVLVSALPLTLLEFHFRPHHPNLLLGGLFCLYIGMGTFLGWMEGRKAKANQIARSEPVQACVRYVSNHINTRATSNSNDKQLSEDQLASFRKELSLEYGWYFVKMSGFYPTISMHSNHDRGHPDPAIDRAAEKARIDQIGRRIRERFALSIEKGKARVTDSMGTRDLPLAGEAASCHPA